MADSNTTLYKLVKPEVGASADTWGSKTNADWDSVDKLLGAITTAGSANAYTLTTGQSLTAYATGQRFRLKLSFSNTGSATLNVDSIGAKTIKKRDASTNVSSGDLASGTIVTVTYDGTNFVLETNLASDLAFQPLDATLTAWGGVTFAADTLGYSTGVDAFATIAFPSASRTQIAAGLGTAALANTGASGATVPLLNVANTWSAAQVFSATTAAVFGADANSSTTVRINSAVGTRQLTFQTASVDRWAFRADSTAESGANAGSNFALLARADDGSLIGTALSITRSSLVAAFGGVVLTPSGSAGAPANSFSGDTNTGSYSVGADDWGVATGGTLRFDISTTAVTSTLPFLAPNASAAAPSFTFSGDADTGMYRYATNTIGFASAGSLAATLSVSALTMTADVILASAAPTDDLSAGFRRFSPASITTGTPVAADSGKTIYATGGVTVPNSVFSAHDSYAILAGGSSRTITQGSGVTLTNGNTGATGSVTLAANGFVTVIHTSASAATVFGNV